MKKRIIFGCAIVCGAIVAFGAAPYALTVERLADPCGVDAAAPRFGWKMAAKHGAVDVTQSAYRVLVATSRERLAAGEGDLWDSGKVPGSQAIDVAYAGKPLASSRRIWWKVRTWDAKDAASDWSLPGQWVTGIMPSDGWKAKWIGPAPETRPDVDLSGAQWITAPKGKKGRVTLQYKFTFAGAKPGEADVCLWSGDRFACCSITIDDNCKPDHDWWLKLSDELGIKLTWFVITDHCVKKNNPGFNGTWADWQRLANAGHSIQSHTTNHKAKHADVPMPTDEELHSMYRDSLKAINDNVTNNFACCIAYPRGEPHPEIAAKYAIACRGVHGVPNAANSIDYMCTGKGAPGKGHVQMVAFGETSEGPKWIQGMKNLRRGWNVVLYHLVHAGRDDATRAKNAASAEAEVRYIASLKDERLWVARFDDAVKYGQERDSATLESALKGDAVEFTLTDRMKDDLFDFPLTVKVRLPDGWKSAKATQGGKKAAVRIVSHEGAPYALVEAVPDRGTVRITKSAL